MKKFGFTLAEVLITLGIIGVVAALTTPALVKNSGQAKIGPSLAKFVNTFETGMETMMTNENVSSLKGIVGGSMIKLADYVVMSPIDISVETGTIYDATGKNVLKMEFGKAEAIKNCMSGHSNNCSGLDLNGDNTIGIGDLVTLNNQYAHLRSAWMLKDGSVMYVMPVLEDEYGANKGAYKGIVAEILVDIDGNKGINKAGKDVFAFLLDASGVLIPVGSTTQKNLKQVGASVIKSYDATCKLNDKFENNFACTGAVADNAWKAEY